MPEAKKIEMVKPNVSRVHPLGNGTQDIYRFKNGYGASVVKFDGSYGYPNLYELAVVKFYGEEIDAFHVDSTTRITDDVLGWQTPEDVQAVLKRISRLRKK